MARKTSLVHLLDMLRVEARISLNPAHNADDRQHQVEKLQRVQETLWEEFDWPHLRVERRVNCQAGQRYYDPHADIPLDRIETIEFFSDGGWRKVLPGIDSAHYAAWNSDLDERSWPIRRFKIHEDEDIEMWPISDKDADPTTLEGVIKYTGIRKLKPLVQDSDRADLDDRLIVLFAAAEILAGRGAKDAKLKMNMADSKLNRLRSRMTPRKSFQMYGTGETKPLKRMAITQYRPPVT